MKAHYDLGKKKFKINNHLIEFFFLPKCGMLIMEGGKIARHGWNKSP